MKKAIITFIISIFFANSSFSQISTEFQLTEASKTAIIWLNNLNSENYPQSYTGLSIQITSRFDSLDWINGVKQMMDSFGEFGGRREISRKFEISIEGLPDGYYAIFQYKSNYKKTLQHSEQLILHQNDKRKWKILDYSYEFKEEE